MKHYKTQDGVVHGFEADGSQDHLIVSGMLPISDADLAILRAPSPQKLWAVHQALAQVALNKSDATAIRCFKAGVAFPAEWKAYTTALRAILAAESGDPAEALPTQPSYPLGS